LVKYWEQEPDATIDTGRNIIRYWNSAGKIQFQAKGINRDGKEWLGRIVPLDCDALRETDGALGVLQNIFAEIA